jgi:hypothetical protein
VVESDFFGVDVGGAPVVPAFVAVEVDALTLATAVVAGLSVDVSSEALDVTINDVVVAVTVVVSSLGFVVVASPCVFVGVFVF